MSARTVQHEPVSGDSWDGLVRLWEETDAPEGCKVEIIEGIITVAPPPANHHNFIAAKVHRCLLAAIPENWEIFQTLNVAIPSRSGLYIPDVVVVPEDLVLEDDGNFISAAAAELAVEITSKSNASHGRIAKAAGYAQAGIPLYLLIDAHAPGGATITLYGEPSNAVYRILQAGKFGATFHIPAPFDLELDTSTFPTP